MKIKIHFSSNWIEADDIKNSFEELTDLISDCKKNKTALVLPSKIRMIINVDNILFIEEIK